MASSKTRCVAYSDNSRNAKETRCTLVKDQDMASSTTRCVAYSDNSLQAKYHDALVKDQDMISSKTRCVAYSDTPSRKLARGRGRRGRYTAEPGSHVHAPVVSAGEYERRPCIVPTLHWADGIFIGAKNGLWRVSPARGDSGGWFPFQSLTSSEALYLRLAGGSRFPFDNCGLSSLRQSLIFGPFGFSLRKSVLWCQWYGGSINLLLWSLLEMMYRFQ